MYVPPNYFSIILTHHNENPITIVAEEIQNKHKLLMVTEKPTETVNGQYIVQCPTEVSGITSELYTVL